MTRRRLIDGGMRALAVLCVCLAVGVPAGAAGGDHAEGEERTSRISDEAAPMIDLDAVPQRPSGG